MMNLDLPGANGDADAMTMSIQGTTEPRVRLVGEVDHADFADAVDLLRSTAQLVATPAVPPELVVVAQSRPGAVPDETIQSLRREAPLAGVVGLLGTWCEGESRTGRPWPGVERLYWYEFPAWWRRQLALRAEGYCPDWARWGDGGSRLAACGRSEASILNPQSAIRNRPRGLIVLSAAVRETAGALADALGRAGYATLWQPPSRPAAVVRGATAGIWDGGQLNGREAKRLAGFCRQLSRDRAPVVALLDFPRRDRCQRVRELGASAVLGKPWLNADLVAMIEQIADDRARYDGMSIIRAA